MFNLNLLFLSGRGGQSALRFARLRMEKRHNYVRKVAETAVQLFVSNDKVNVAGMVLAGSADFKTELSQSDMFDPVSLSVFIKTIQILKRVLLCNIRKYIQKLDAQSIWVLSLLWAKYTKKTHLSY